MHNNQHADLVLRLVRPGDTLTHTRCMGCIEEHIFLRMEGPMLCGRPTADTTRLEGSVQEANDILPANVTHINRVPVDVAGFLTSSWRERLKKTSASALRRRKTS